jgi:hypothetical protein
MQYSLVMYVDHDQEPLGFLQMETNVGPVVAIFSDQAALAVATTYARNTARPGMAVSVVTTEAASPGDVVAKIAEGGADDDWLAGVTFVTDGDEGFDAVLAYMREQNAALPAAPSASTHPRRP